MYAYIICIGRYYNMNKMNYNADSIIQGMPQAVAVINGSRQFPDISGITRFYQTSSGVIVFTEVNGLPMAESKCSQKIFGFHIHGGMSCSGNKNDPFANSGTHYDTANCGHPSHSGDMPPLFGSSGKAVSMFLTNRFTVDEIIGKVIIIHNDPDDFKTQPSGGAGIKIACGVIRKN